MALRVGVDTNAVCDLQHTLEAALKLKYDFVAVPLFHPRAQRGSDELSARRAALIPATRSDLVLSSGAWTRHVVGKVSSWLALDSSCAHVRLRSERALRQELEWAAHLSVPAVLLPPPMCHCTNYARQLGQAALNSSYLQLWVKVSMSGETHAGSAGSDQSWGAWNRLRTLCDSHPNLGVALAVGGKLPPDSVVQRWLGEPIRAALLPTSIFVANAGGYPTLSTRHQELIRRLLEHNVQLLVVGRPIHGPGVAAAQRAGDTPEAVGVLKPAQADLRPYLQYLSHLASRVPPLSEGEKFVAPYRDFLQAPLQPLMDNLESQMYETFERDPVKYAQYEKAVAAALARTNVQHRSVLMVVGAGRGPLVRASLRAAETAQREVLVYAVEKNPNAVMTLQNARIDEGWGERVHIVASDMRLWQAPVKADIMVSELLGSFGDNELSPECLDGAQQYLAPHGVSIPQNYTSFVAPMTSSKLWNMVKAMGKLASFETPYVVKLHNFCELDTAQRCFFFSHPNKPPVDNQRFVTIDFTARENAVLHGFAGYFESVLYGEHAISINPATFSDGMFSWFPMYFPLKEPITVSKGQAIQAHFWRCISPSKIWYEWAVTVGAGGDIVSAVHNPTGRSSSMSLST